MINILDNAINLWYIFLIRRLYHMMGWLLYSLGAVMLLIGCIRQSYEKSGLNVACEFLGAFLMIFSYCLKW